MSVDLTTERMWAPPSTRPVDLALAFAVTFLPPLGFIVGLYYWRQISWVEILCWLTMHGASLIGVELGFHRLFSHRAYRPHRALKIILAAMGSMAFQGPAIWWASIHRRHHQHSDMEGDPHSMYLYGGEGKFTWRGALHAHIGWIWSKRSIGRGGYVSLARELYQDRDILWIHMHYAYFLLAGFLLPGFAAGLIHSTWQGAALGILWGGFIRVFIMNHLTYWCINSVTHGVGKVAYLTGDRSTNFMPLTIFTLGQSLHNNHHAFPSSAVMAHRRNEIDPGGWLLYLLKRVRLVTDMVLPSEAAIDAKYSQTRGGTDNENPKANYANPEPRRNPRMDGH